MAEQQQTNYHHLFGLMVQDFFRGTPCEVELERDLSVKSQFLDVLILHKTAAILDRVLPDGLEGHLAEYNLITFKSHREALTGWSILELLGHYVNLRKQASPNFDDLLPEDRFLLFAICAREPVGLAGLVDLAEVQTGVYEIDLGLATVRVIVAGLLPQTEPNALLHLFSASRSLLEYGRQHCPVRSPETSTLVADLCAGYTVEGLTMPITMEEYIRNSRKRTIQEASVEERLEGIPSEQRLEGIPSEQRLEGIPTEQIIDTLFTQTLTPEAREKLRRLYEELPPA